MANDNIFKKTTSITFLFKYKKQADEMVEKLRRKYHSNLMVVYNGYYYECDKYDYRLEVEIKEVDKLPRRKLSPYITKWWEK